MKSTDFPGVVSPVINRPTGTKAAPKPAPAPKPKPW